MNLTSARGFTLIEMVLVILIMGIIIAMSSSLLTQGLNSFTLSENITNANWQGQLALERMTRDIMSVRSSTDITTSSASQFSFTDTSNNTISYTSSSGNLTLTLNGNTATLATGVSNLAFSYFDKDGAVTATASLIRLIRVSITISQTDAVYTLTTAIFPRNLS